MVNIDIEALKKAGFSYEEIQGIIESEKDIEMGKTLSENEMNTFIKDELFSKYITNV